VVDCWFEVLFEWFDWIVDEFWWLNVCEECCEELIVIVYELCNLNELL